MKRRRYSVPIRSHVAACIVANALREHRQNDPYFNAPLDSPDQIAARDELDRLYRRALSIAQAEEWRAPAD
jgi:hypothetical protein